MSREEKSNLMLSLVEQWQQSGQSQGATRQTEGVSIVRIYKPGKM